MLWHCEHHQIVCLVSSLLTCRVVAALTATNYAVYRCRECFCCCVAADVNAPNAAANAVNTGSRAANTADVHAADVQAAYVNL